MRKIFRELGSSGQVLVGVIAILLVIAILVPAMVFYVQYEAKWAQKSSEEATAFHLAEAGVEKGYRAISLSTSNWYNLIDNGDMIDRMDFDFSFDDVVGGVYTVSITSGPEERQATIISIGKDARKGTARALKVIYTQNIMGEIAIQAMDGVQVAGGVQVEWGAVVGPDHIDTNSRTYPKFYSGSSLDVDGDPNPPNCDQPDCCQWFSFDQDVPPDPGIDLDFYRSSAQATTAGCPAGGVDYGSGATCYFSGNQSWSSVDYAGGSTVFVEGDMNMDSPGIDIIGSLVITGNFSSSNGGWGKGSVNMSVPETAWRQYCNNWAHYQSFDGDAPASWPGADSVYESSPTLTFNPTGNKTAIQGFMYVGGNFSVGGGGGSCEIYGALFIVGNVTIDSASGVVVYYNKVAAEGIKTRSINLSRYSWEGLVRQWPSHL